MKKATIIVKSHAILRVVIAIILATSALTFCAIEAYGATGNVYSAKITRTYRHPVTNVIEDSGGEGGYSTGQGMVEGIISSDGLLEVTDDGGYYLTFKMTMMDYTANHEFFVQNVGESNWSKITELGVTGTGSDANGTTNDICVRVSSENCIVKCSMYVHAMGRSVIFFFYPSDYTLGNSTAFLSTIVSESSDSASANSSSANPAGSGSAQGTTTSPSPSTNSTSSSSTPSLSSTLASGSGTSSSDSKTPSTASSLNSASGLTLSTADSTSEATSPSNAASSGNLAFEIGLAITISGLVLMGTAAVLVYYFRRNWMRWGGAPNDF